MIEMFTSVMRIYLAFIKSLKSATVSLLAFKTPAPPPTLGWRVNPKKTRLIQFPWVFGSISHIHRYAHHDSKLRYTPDLNSAH